jgi:membrane protein required for colicin V production
MNWLDLVLLALLVFAAVRGFMRGFLVEVCGLVGLILGIWAGVHFNRKVGEWLGLDAGQEMLAFAITMVIVIVLVSLLARMITRAMDAAQMGLPNKVAGIVFGVLRAAFTLSIVLNVVRATEAQRPIIKKETREGSSLYEPLRAFAPMIIPALGETKWVKRALDEVEEHLDDHDDVD